MSVPWWKSAAFNVFIMMFGIVLFLVAALIEWKADYTILRRDNDFFQKEYKVVPIPDPVDKLRVSLDGGKTWYAAHRDGEAVIIDGPYKEK